MLVSLLTEAAFVPAYSLTLGVPAPLRSELRPRRGSIGAEAGRDRDVIAGLEDLFRVLAEVLVFEQDAAERLSDGRGLGVVHFEVVFLVLPYRLVVMREIPNPKDRAVTEDFGEEGGPAFLQFPEGRGGRGRGAPGAAEVGRDLCYLSGARSCAGAAWPA